MKQCSVWVFAAFILIGLLSLSVISVAEEGKWTEKAKMPAPRRSAAAAAVDGKIYVIGGTDTTWNALSTVEAYDPVEDKWTKKANMRTPRFRLSACVVNGKIYAIGGTASDISPAALASVEEYDPATDTWTKKTDMPTARHSLSASAVDGKIYAIGGAKGGIVMGELPVGFGTVEEYDPATDTWVRKASMITPRYGHAAGVVRGKIHIVGGAQEPADAANTVEEYDPAKNKWTEKADAPTVRLFHTASVTNSKIYAIGGIDLGGIDPLLTMEEYDPATNMWTKKTNMLSARCAASSGVVNGKIYVVGGWPGWVLGFAKSTVFPTVEEYTPKGWLVSPQGKLASTWAMIKTSSGF